MTTLSNYSLYFYEGDDGEPTVVTDLTPAPVTFVGHITPLLPRSPRTIRCITAAAAAAALLIMVVSYLFTPERPAPQRGASAEAVGSDLESLQATTRDTRPKKSKYASSSPSPLERVAADQYIEKRILHPEVEDADRERSRQNRMSTGGKRSSMRGLGDSKQLRMRTRIEIVDGVERCYAIPGGNEISC
jgi:hypothetical protein